MAKHFASGTWWRQLAGHGFSELLDLVKRGFNLLLLSREYGNVVYNGHIGIIPLFHIKNQ